MVTKQFFGMLSRGSSAEDRNQLAIVRSNQPDAVERGEHFIKTPDAEQIDTEQFVTDLALMMETLKDQALGMRYEFTKLNNWATQFDLLASRVSTMQPLLNGALQKSLGLERELSAVTASREGLARKASDLEGEVNHYRPLCVRLEEEVRTLRSELTSARQYAEGLEADHQKAQANINSLLQKLSTSESVRQRVAEEGAAIERTLRDNTVATQTLMREVAQLKSSLSAATGEMERLEVENAHLREKLVQERDSGVQLNSAMKSLKLKEEQSRRELAAQLKEAERREQTLSQALNAKEKDLYDLEIKHSGLLSKTELLVRMNDRLREDVRRHVDHIGTVEASNRQLLESLSRNAHNNGPATDNSANVAA